VAAVFSDGVETVSDSFTVVATAQDTSPDAATVNTARRSNGHRRRGFGCSPDGAAVNDGGINEVGRGALASVRFGTGGGATGPPTTGGAGAVVRTGGVSRGVGVIENGLRSLAGATSAEGQGVSFSVLGGSHMVGPSLVAACEASFTFHPTSEK
jgi:hypothetical protein